MSDQILSRFRFLKNALKSFSADYEQVLVRMVELNVRQAEKLIFQRYFSKLMELRVDHNIGLTEYVFGNFRINTKYEYPKELRSTIEIFEQFLNCFQFKLRIEEDRIELVGNNDENLEDIGFFKDRFEYKNKNDNRFTLLD